MDNIKDLGKVCITPEGAWDINKQYERLALVTGLEPDPLNPAVEQVVSYVSRKNVPAGSITLNNKEYWQKFTNKVTWEDLYVGDDGWIYIGDTPIYELKLNDILGDIVVEKIEQGLTEKIMQAITTYMGGVVSNFVNAITGQIDRLITQGIKVNNNHSGNINNKLSGSVNVDAAVSGEIENNNTNVHSGELGITHKGQVAVAHSGRINTDVALSGGIDVNGGVTPPAPITKYRLTVNPTPSDATVTLNGEPIRSGEFEENSTVEVIIYKSGYVTKTQTVTIAEDTVLNITLEQIVDNYTFTPDHTKTELDYNESPAILGVISKKNGQDAEWAYEVKSGQSYVNGNINKEGSTLTVPVKVNENTASRSIVIKFTQNGSNNSFETTIIQNGKPDVPGPTEEYVFELSDVNFNFYDEEYIERAINSYKIVNGVKTYLPFQMPNPPYWLNVTPTENNTKIKVTTRNALIGTEGWFALEQLENGNPTGETIQIFVKVVGSIYTTFEANPNRFDNVNNEGAELSSSITSEVAAGEPLGWSINRISNPDMVSAVKDGNRLRITVNPNTTQEAKSYTIKLLQEQSGRDLTVYINQNAAPAPVEEFEITVAPITEGATVKMNDIVGNPQIFNKGSNITVVISKEGYNTKTENINNLQADTTINGVLTPIIIFKPNNVTKQSEGVYYKEIDRNPVNNDNLGITIDSNVGGVNKTYTATSDKSWCTVNIVDGVPLFTISQNTVRSYREANITFTQNDTGESFEIIIHQNGITEDEYVLEVTTKEFTFNTQDEYKQTSFISTKNGDYNRPTVTVYDDLPWIHYTIVDSEANKYIRITVDNNTLTSERNGVIIVTNGDKEERIIIRQNGLDLPYTFEVNPDRHENISANGQSGLESIVTSKRGDENVNWYIEPNTQYNFITNVRKDGNKIKFDVPENTTFDSRSDSITVVQERPEGSSQIYLIVQQEARTEEFSANPTDFYLNKDGDNKTSTITSTINGAAANWTVENTPSWCNAERNGNILNISVAQNTGASRTGTITLKQTGTQNTITIQVTQDGTLVEFVFTKRTSQQGDYGPYPIDEIPVDFHGNSITEIILIARVKVNDVLTDNVAEISQFGLVDGDIDKFTLEKITNVDGKYEALRILTNGAAPQSGDYYTSSLQFDVEYDGRTVNIEKDIDWSD